MLVQRGHQQFMWATLNREIEMNFVKFSSVPGGLTSVFENHIKEEKLSSWKGSFVSTFDVFLVLHSLGLRRL